mmetsp:Transcript_27886/g.73012  ORF Transcript_27886/g.73012 Transcript_27886/m.73012 type:complete len:271 (+) Transcript_27886:687-1499(+)
MSTNFSSASSSRSRVTPKRRRQARISRNREAVFISGNSSRQSCRQSASLCVALAGCLWALRALMVSWVWGLNRPSVCARRDHTSWSCAMPLSKSSARPSRAPRWHQWQPWLCMAISVVECVLNSAVSLSWDTALSWQSSASSTRASQRGSEDSSLPNSLRVWSVVGWAGPLTACRPSRASLKSSCASRLASSVSGSVRLMAIARFEALCRVSSCFFPSISCRSCKFSRCMARPSSFRLRPISVCARPLMRRMVVGWWRPCKDSCCAFSSL